VQNTGHCVKYKKDKAIAAVGALSCDKNIRVHEDNASLKAARSLHEDNASEEC